LFLLLTGCTFYRFNDAGFTGDGMPIRGPVLYTQAPGYDYGIGRGFRSWYTDCDMVKTELQK
jgi:hypothetical protein